jgi:peptidoglycan/LPS O-acetylase OafA/YrhL
LVTLLQQPEYVHVLINHLPVTGLFAALLFLIAALVARKRVAIFLGMALVSLFALSAWPVSEYGEAGYDRVYSMADDTGGAYLKQHRELADRWVWLFYVTAAVGAGGMVAGWKWPRCLWATASAVVVLTVGSLVAGAVIADYGGKVRHPEFRRQGDLKGASSEMNAPARTSAVAVAQRPS